MTKKNTVPEAALKETALLKKCMVHLVDLRETPTSLSLSFLGRVFVCLITSRHKVI